MKANSVILCRDSSIRLPTFCSTAVKMVIIFMKCRICGSHLERFMIGATMAQPECFSYFWWGGYGILISKPGFPLEDLYINYSVLPCLKPHDVALCCQIRFTAPIFVIFHFRHMLVC